MPDVTSYIGGNALLDGLPVGELQLIAPLISVINIPARTTPYHALDRFEAVHFPIDAVYSIVALMKDGATCEVGTIGCDGCSPIEARMGAVRASRTTFAQVGGRVARMELVDFTSAIDRCPGFAATTLRYLTARLFAAEQYTACNLMHLVVQRLARWLLVTRDRVGRNEFTLTHDLLAIMLGVRRPGVTKAAQELHAMGAIDYRRGLIIIRDVAALQSAACECYGVTREAGERTIGPRSIGAA